MAVNKYIKDESFYAIQLNCKIQRRYYNRIFGRLPYFFNKKCHSAGFVFHGVPCLISLAHFTFVFDFFCANLCFFCLSELLLHVELVIMDGVLSLSNNSKTGVPYKKNGVQPLVVLTQMLSIIANEDGVNYTSASLFSLGSMALSKTAVSRLYRSITA